RMDSLQEQADGRLDRFIDVKNPIAFFRPEDLARGDLPAKAPRLTEPLRISQIGLVPSQCSLGSLLVLDVVAHSIPSGHLSVLVAKRHAAHQMPPIFAIGAPQPLFHLERLADRQVSSPSGFNQWLVIRMDSDSPALSAQAVLGKTRI